MVFSSSKNLATSFFRSRLYELTGLIFLIFSLGLSAALLTHAPTDPSWNLVANSETQNLLGSFGAITSDLFLQFFGPLSYILPLFFVGVGFFLFSRPKRFSLLLRCVLFLCGFFLLLSSLSFWEKGGALGYILFKSLDQVPLSPLKLSLSLLALSLPFLLITSGIKLSHLKTFFSFIQKKSQKSKPIKKTLSSPLFEDNYIEVKEVPKNTAIRLKEYVKSPPQKTAPSQPFSLKPFYAGDPYQLPPLELLYIPKNFTQKIDYDEDSLQENAGALEAVLKDYGIRGEIVGIKPGPVVTL